jgi:predicted TIM-barrel fold metal-dependent hydrolase
MTMRFVDSQVHLWAAESPTRPWPPGRAKEAQKPYQILKETLLFQMDLAGVSRMVLVPPSWEGDRNDMALEAARAYPDRFAVMGRLNLGDPASRDLVAGWRRQSGMLGMRFTFHNEHYRHFLTDGTAGKHPGLKLVIDHVGIAVRGKAPQVFEELPKVLALAKHPNVSVKASGMPSLSAQPYPFPDLHEAIRRMVDAFGPRRVFWGTDLTRMPCTYYECITLFTQHLPWLKGEDLEWVMGRGVCEWLGWPLPRQ